MHESGANHVLGEEVGVGVPADPVIDDGLPQALQPVGEAVWGAGRQVSVPGPCSTVCKYYIFLCIT